MRFLKKKALKVMSNGASFSIFVSSLANKKNSQGFFEKDFNNMFTYLKHKDISLGLSSNKNALYRKKYLK